jgi:raffinose/stachyose/melibiose transport system permease protein
MERTLVRWWPLFVLPTFLAFLIGFVIPFGMGLYLSFCDFTTLSNAVFTGFENYLRAFSDASGEFIHALWYTALFAALSTLIINVLSLIVALLLVRGFRGTNVFRTVFFLPNLIGGIVLGYVFSLLVNGLLGFWGVDITFSAAYGFWGLVALNT